MGLGDGGKTPKTRIFFTVFMKNLGGQWSLLMKLFQFFKTGYVQINHDIPTKLTKQNV